MRQFQNYRAGVSTGRVDVNIFSVIELLIEARTVDAIVPEACARNTTCPSAASRGIQRRAFPELLRVGSGRAAAIFREGQEDAIRYVIEGRGRLLLVQKTGWGKSFVYFIATGLLREAGAGPALLVSPLLALMRNQIAAAERMGVRAVTINSDNQVEWAAVERRSVGMKSISF